jgi:phytoene desaturase
LSSLRPDTVVVGAGLGGLAVALRMRARGCKTVVIDRLPSPGGRAREFVRGRYRYDAGPTVLTAPDLFGELFTLFGERLSDHVELLPVAPWYQMRFDDGTCLNYGGSTEQIQKEIARFSVDDAAQYPAYLAWSQRLYAKGYEELGTEPFSGWWSMLKVLPTMLRLRADRSVYKLTAKYFKDERVRRAFSIQPLLVGGNPFNTTSIYSLIHYLERKSGVWFPRGGMAALVSALVALGERHGVNFIWNTTVSRVTTLSKDETTTKRGRFYANSQHVSGVASEDGRVWQTQQVVLNADPGHALLKMLPGAQNAARRLKRKRYAMSVFVWYFTTAKQYPQVPHHTILFGRTYRETLHDVFEGARLPRDLSIYLHRPGATDPNYSPAGTDAFYALVPVPNLEADIDWSQQGAQLRDRLSAELAQRVLPDFQNHLVDDFFLTPQYFSDELLSPWGSAFSLRPTLNQSAGFRFPNQSPDISGLYFVGAGVHPGAGVPGVVTSAKVVERQIFGSVQ